MAHSILGWIIIGIVAGWLTGKIMKGSGFGWLMDMVIGLIFVTYALPVMCIRWWVKYGSIKTDDADFPRARLTAIIVTAIAFLNLCRDAGTRVAHHL